MGRPYLIRMSVVDQKPTPNYTKQRTKFISSPLIQPFNLKSVIFHVQSINKTKLNHEFTDTGYILPKNGIISLFSCVKYK